MHLIYILAFDVTQKHLLSIFVYTSFPSSKRYGRWLAFDRSMEQISLCCWCYLLAVPQWYTTSLAINSSKFSLVIMKIQQLVKYELISMFVSVAGSCEPKSDLCHKEEHGVCLQVPMTKEFHYPTEKIIQLFLKRPRVAIATLIYKFVINSRHSRSEVESLNMRMKRWNTPSVTQKKGTSL